MKSWLITGISRGLGLALAEAALARGDTVVGTVRGSVPSIAEGNGTLHVLKLDVTERVEIVATVDEAFVLADGKIDIVVNNAGFGLLGAIEEATADEVAKVFAANFLGTLNVIQAALPHLRVQKCGHIINITSIAGHAPGTGAGIYAAAKHAVEGLSKCLSQEVAPFGIKVTAVAPGAFRTDFASDHSLLRSKAAVGIWVETVDSTRSAFDKMHGNQLGDPKLAAQAMLKLADADNPPLHLFLGSDALNRARAKFDAFVTEVDSWHDVTLSTDSRINE
jgi:NAD(P)-dependent dehydrogenase (short-subunit alcohol dehydrogenase family)